MPRLLPVVLALLSSSSCLGLYQTLSGHERADAAEIRALAQPSFPSCSEPLKVEERDWSTEMHWLVTGCTGKLACDEIDGARHCFPFPPKVSDFGSARVPLRFRSAAASVAELTGCLAGDTRVQPAGDEQPLVTIAENCERNFVCVSPSDFRGNILDGPGKCDETAESQNRTALRVAVDRLALETKCPAESIEVDSHASWLRGSERAYRLKACGKQYVCTTAAGRTDCKVALDVAAP